MVSKRKVWINSARIFFCKRASAIGNDSRLHDEKLKTPPFSHQTVSLFCSDSFISNSPLVMLVKKDARSDDGTANSVVVLSCSFLKEKALHDVGL